MFHPAARARYDVALTMYHDQGLIPAKTLAFDDGVNVTLGLPFVRTSPDHGTAFDIAGKGLANPSSLIAALQLAARLARLERSPRDGLPPLREVVAAHGLERRNRSARIFCSISISPAASRAPPGRSQASSSSKSAPAPAASPARCSPEGAKKVIAIERDERCLAALAEKSPRIGPAGSKSSPGDALEMRLADLVERARGAPLRICANLPYNIATPLLTGWLESEPWPPFFDRLTLMFQREVALRIVATPAERADYGRLGVLAGWRTRARMLFDVPPSAFTPPPKVTSSVVELIPRETPEPCDAAMLSALTQAAFGQRRKMLRQSLKGFAAARGLDLAAWLEDAGSIRPSARKRSRSPRFAALARSAKDLRER